MTKKRIALVVLLGVLVTGAATLWWVYPAHRIRRELRVFDVPAGVTLTDEEIADNGWICFDQCSYGDRYYVSTLTANELAAAVERELGDRGYDVGRDSCGDEEYPSWMTYAIVDCAYVVHTSRGGLSTSVLIGRRNDGRTGMDLSITFRGW